MNWAIFLPEQVVVAARAWRWDKLLGRAGAELIGVIHVA